jgi:hypothetical protein
MHKVGVPGVNARKRCVLDISLKVTACVGDECVVFFFFIVGTKFAHSI